MSTQLHENNKEANMPSNKHIIYKGGSYKCNKEVESAHIDTNVTAIKEYTFQFCANLKKVTFPDTSSVTSIGYQAFYSCDSLQHINLPSSITTIGEYAFNRCSSLQSVILPSSISVIPKDVFSGCKSLTTINIPNSVTSIGYQAFRECKSLQSISIPQSLTTIEEFAFYD